MKDIFSKPLGFLVVWISIFYPHSLRAENLSSATDAFGKAYEQAYERLRVLGKSAPVEEKQRVVRESLAPYHQAQDDFNRELAKKRKPHLDELDLPKAALHKVASKKSAKSVVLKKALAQTSEKLTDRAPSSLSSTRTRDLEGESKPPSGIKPGGAEEVDFNWPPSSK